MNDLKVAHLVFSRWCFVHLVDPISKAPAVAMVV